MTDSLENKIIQVIRSALCEKNNIDELHISATDSMSTISCWDSLAFMTVFLAINEEFGIDPDFDDAIHYTSVQTLTEYLTDKAA